LINYTEKPGLPAHLESLGISILHVDGSAVSNTEDSIVQSAIDNYDPLPLVRSDAKNRIIQQANAAGQALESLYPEIEKRTFPKQEAEALAFVEDSSAVVPILAAISVARGVPVSVLADKVIENTVVYTAQVGTLAGARQKADDLIEAETDYTVIQQINLVL